MIDFPRYYPGGRPPIDRASGFDRLEMLRWMESRLATHDPAFRRAVELLNAALTIGLTDTQMKEIDTLAADAVADWKEDQAMHRDQERAGWREMLERKFFAGELVPEGRA